MEITEQIRRFQEFFEENYHVELLEKVRKGENFIYVDFGKLSLFDPELAGMLLDQPEEIIEAANMAVKQFDFNKDIKNFKIRMFNLPKSQDILIRNIRSVNISKIICLQGIVRQKSDVRPQVTIARFECPSCGNNISVLQVDSKFREPATCGCGRKGRFRLVGKELVDAQKLVLEEAPEKLEGGEQPKRIDVFLKDDLVSPIGDKKTNPGTKIIVVGMVKEVPIIGKDGEKLTRFDLMVDANYIEPVEEEFGDIIIDEEEEKQILELSKDPKVYQKLINSIAPSIFGHERVKEAILLQLLGGVKKSRSDGVVTRGDMHILLIGDPGSGKSQMLKRATVVAPKARYVSGKGASGAGLTAAVVKDDFLRGWALEAGALVLANNGFCMIDELDKMSDDDRSAMHEALEQQTVTISKANIQATLRAETAVLAAANPKWGRFDVYETITKQIDLPSTLINRFDLIFPIKDIPDKSRDNIMAKFILNLHQVGDVQEAEVPTELLRKYVAYARQRIVPKLSDAAVEYIQEYYVRLRNTSSDDPGAKSVPISARQLEALVRLAEASAKARLSDKVTKRDAARAIDILHFCLNQVGMDPETGQIDIDRISVGITSSERNKIIHVKEIIDELENKIGKTIPIDDLVRECIEKGIGEDKVDEVIEKLKRSGDIFEPRRGFIQKI